jgi:SAM-dependent methyltransferase
MARYDVREYWRGLHALNRGLLSAVGYAALGEGFNKAAYVLRRNALLRLLRRNTLRSKPSVLEAASGVGAYARAWRRLEASVWVGLDISADAVAHCRRLYPAGQFLEQDLTAEDWPAIRGRAFDLVTAIDVLYHLVDEPAFEAALRNLASCVPLRGMLLISDVFVPRDKQIAPHVRRRSLETYQKVLGPDMVLVDREPVFAVLGDSVPRSPRRLADHALLTAWKLIARSLLATPAALRDPVGAGLVAMAWPLDSLLRRTGMTRGVNLELALFRRDREYAPAACRPQGAERRESAPVCAA